MKETINKLFIMKLKHILLAILATFAFVVILPAQTTRIPQRNEIVSIETEDDLGDISSILDLLGGGGDIREVFDVPSDDGAHHYFLSVGHLGFGDEVVQLMFDPAFELFIPLGDTLDEALETLEAIQDLFGQSRNSSMQVQGCLAFAIPDSNLETVTVTYRRPFLSRMLEFSVQRENYIRSSHVGKGDFSSLVRGVKLYKMLHPEE